jgi:hypothetical protein
LESWILIGPGAESLIRIILRAYGADQSAPAKVQSNTYV